MNNAESDRNLRRKKKSTTAGAAKSGKGKSSKKDVDEIEICVDGHTYCIELLEELYDIEYTCGPCK